MVPVATLLGAQYYKASTGSSSPNKYRTTNTTTLKKIKSGKKESPIIIKIFTGGLAIMLNTLSSLNIEIISSPEPLGSQGELIVYPSSRRPSVVRRPPFSKIFFSETAWPIKAKFYVQPPWEGGTKVYINGPGHMTKMATRPIYGKNPSKIFFSRTGGPIFTKLGL